MSHSYAIDDSIPATAFKFRKTGGSVSIIIPAANAALLDVKEGATGKIAHTVTGELVLIPDRATPPPSYKLADLLAEVKDHVDTPDLQNWETMRPEGTEI